MMEQKRKALSLQVITPKEMDTSLFSEVKAVPEPQRSEDTRKTNWFLSIPMQTCVFCEPLIQTAKCKYLQRVNNRLMKDADVLKACCTIVAKVEIESASSIEKAAASIIGLVKEKFTGISPEEIFESSYCLLAHVSDKVLHEQREETSKLIRANCRQLLNRFYSLKEKNY
jgi:hypothetical protein